MIETKVTWRGRDSLAAIAAALHQHGRAEILLPPEYHHALWRGLGEVGPGVPEVLDIVGGGELLDRVAAIDGLSELAPLRTLLGEAQGEVRVTSPSPVIHIDLGKADGEKPLAAA